MIGCDFDGGAGRAAQGVHALAIGTATGTGVATPAGFETVTVKCDALELGASAACGAVMKRANFNYCRAEQRRPSLSQPLEFFVREDLFSGDRARLAT